jgi:uncharacterized protein (TIGR02391 family)
MTREYQAFRSEAIETLAQIVGDFYTGSEITRLFQRSGYRDIAHDGGTKWRFAAAAFEQLQARSGGKPHGVLKVIETACNPQGWINRREYFERFLGSVNSVLEFYGLRAADNGTLIFTGEQATTVRRAKTPDESAFDGRCFHPHVVRHGRSHFARGAYFHAVFECCKAFDTAVRDNTGIAKSGQPLMSEALSPSGPLKLNSQRTQSEKDEQLGIMFLCMGLMNAVRNPQAHEPELNWPMTRDDALDVLALISFLFRKLESAIVVSPATGSGMKVKL